MATVIGKTSVKIDELLGPMIIKGELTPEGYLIYTSRSGAIINAGRIILPAQLEEVETNAATYVDSQIADLTADLPAQFTAAEDAAKAYADQRLAEETLIITGAVADVDARVDIAIQKAVEAQYDADMSSKVYIQDEAPDGREQDLWIDTTAGANTPKRWDGFAWVVATDQTAVNAAASVAAFEGRVTTVEGAVTSQESRLDTAEGSITSVQSRMTTAEGTITSTSGAVSSLSGTVSGHTSRLNTAEGQITTIGGRIDSTDAQVIAQSTRIGEAEDDIVNIVTVQLPNKNKSTYSTSPASGPNVKGDIWFQKVAGEIIGQWEGNGGTSWIPLTLTDAVITNLHAGTVTAGTFAGERIAVNAIETVHIATVGLDAAVVKFGEMEGERIKTGSLSVTKVIGLQETLAAGGVNLLTGGYDERSATLVEVPVREALKDHINKQITVSFDLRVSAPATIQVYAYQAHGISIDSGRNCDATLSWQRFTHTTTVEDYGLAFGTERTQGSLAFYDFNGTTTVYVRNVKIELGPTATPYSFAAGDVVDKSDEAAIKAVESAFTNKNSTLDQWASGSHPFGFATWSTTPPTKNSTDGLIGKYSAEWANIGTSDVGMYGSESLSSMPLDIEYLVAEVDVMLKSGTTFSGAGLLIDWTGRSLYRSSLVIKDAVPAPALNKWYRVTQTIKRPTSTGTQTGWAMFVMANYAGDGLGAKTDKTILFDRVAVRPATSAEVIAYNTPGNIATAKAEAIVSAQAAAVTEMKNLWGHPSDSTFIDGGDIYTNTIKASSILISDFTNYVPDPNLWVGSGVNGFIDEEGPVAVITGNGTGNTHVSMGSPTSAYDIPVIGTSDLNTTDQFLFSWHVYANYAGYSGSSGTYFQWLNKDRTVLSAAASAATVPQGTSTYITQTVNLIAPNGAAFLRFSPYASANAKVAIRQPRLRRKAAGSLIVDGAIDGKTITGATIQTSTTSDRGIKLLPTGLLAYSDGTGGIASGLATISINSTTGNMVLRGNLAAGSTISAARITGVLQTSDTDFRGIKMVSNKFVAYPPTALSDADASLIIDGNTGAITMRGDLASGSTIIGATYKTAVSGERVELNGTNIGRVSFYSGNTFESSTGPGVLESDVILGQAENNYTTTARMRLQAPTLTYTSQSYAPPSIELSSFRYTAGVNAGKGSVPQIDMKGNTYITGLLAATTSISAGADISAGTSIAAGTSLSVGGRQVYASELISRYTAGDGRVNGATAWNYNPQVTHYQFNVTIPAGAKMAFVKLAWTARAGSNAAYTSDMTYNFNGGVDVALDNYYFHNDGDQYVTACSVHNGMVVISGQSGQLQIKGKIAVASGGASFSLKPGNCAVTFWG